MVVVIIIAMDFQLLELFLLHFTTPTIIAILDATTSIAINTTESGWMGLYILKDDLDFRRQYIAYSYGSNMYSSCASSCCNNYNNFNNGIINTNGWNNGYNPYNTVRWKQSLSPWSYFQISSIGSGVTVSGTPIGSGVTVNGIGGGIGLNTITGTH